jgi:hypothetical protein
VRAFSPVKYGAEGGRDSCRKKRGRWELALSNYADKRSTISEEAPGVGRRRLALAQATGDWQGAGRPQQGYSCPGSGHEGALEQSQGSRKLLVAVQLRSEPPQGRRN